MEFFRITLLWTILCGLMTELSDGGKGSTRSWAILLGGFPEPVWGNNSFLLLFNTVDKLNS
jgi:hypothetical protein